MLGVQGFAYALDQSAGTVPSPGTISLQALDFAGRQELSVGTRPLRPTSRTAALRDTVDRRPQRVTDNLDLGCGRQGRVGR